VNPAQTRTVKTRKTEPRLEEIVFYGVEQNMSLGGETSELSFDFLNWIDDPANRLS